MLVFLALHMFANRRSGLLNFGKIIYRPQLTFAQLKSHLTIATTKLILYLDVMARNRAYSWLDVLLLICESIKKSSARRHIRTMIKLVQCSFF